MGYGLGNGTFWDRMKGWGMEDEGNGFMGIGNSWMFRRNVS